MFDIHPFNRPFTGEPWKEPKIRKPYKEIMPHCHWRVQDLANAMTGAKLCIKEMAELQAVNVGTQSNGSVARMDFYCCAKASMSVKLTEPTG